MKILSIESSCDETAASILEVAEDNSHVKLLSAVTATSLHLHAKTGGIIPEIAARNQIKDILPVIYEALVLAKCIEPSVKSKNESSIPYALSPKPAVDAIAVTYGPGLIGSLLVGVETAKTLSYVWDIPLIPINHLFGHLYANWIETASGQVDAHQQHQFFTLPTFPAIGLIISGGHTDLLFLKSHTDITWLGGTRDDAAGEAFDKIGRMLGLAYPAGPKIEELAKKGHAKAFHFPRPLMYDKEFDFSFSGLKTAVLRVVEKQSTLDDQIIADICLATQDAISDVLIYKTLQAVKHYTANAIILGGGVAANETLLKKLQQTAQTKFLEIKIFVPKKSLCTDNAPMIGAAALFQGNETSWKNVTANPELYFD